MRSLGKAKDEDEAGEIDLTPMLDVVFILLIFFIVTAVFVKEAGYEVLRPVADTKEETRLDPIFIAVSPLGEIWTDGDIVPARSIRSRIEQRLAESPNAAVIIQADRDAENEYVMLIMEAAREAQVTDIQIAAE